MLNEVFEAAPKGAGDVSVDIVEFSRNRDVGAVPKEDPDATENSSSFAESTSENENISGLSDTEVESQLFGDNDLGPPFDGFSSVFPMRKKKLTGHWRNFIHPLMWRCKWAELRIKELESQASKYSRHTSVHERRKQMLVDRIKVEQFGLRSLPFTNQNYTKKPMKRRKRKRVEDTTDIAAYMSNHNLFSERENKRSDLDGVHILEDLGNSDHHNTEFGIQDDGIFPDDNGNSLEDILRKIELVHSRVNKLKSRLDTVMINNSGKFSSSENLSQLVPCDVQTSPTFSGCGLYTPPQHIPDYDLSDFMLPDSAVSSFGEAIPIPDIIESTVGLLSSIDVTQHHPLIGDSSEKIVDNILIHNEAAELEGSAFKNTLNQSAEEKAEEGENSGEEESNNAVSAAVGQEQSILKSCLAKEIHFPKNKRKRGERKAGSANWSRQRPAESDS